MIAVLVLAALVALRWGILLVAAAALVPEVRGCPACFAATVPIHRPWLSRLLPRIEWRWCASCGWQGPGRRPGGTALSPPVGERAPSTRDASGDAPSTDIEGGRSPFPP